MDVSEITVSKSLTDMTPPEIDEVLFPLWAERWALQDRIYRHRRMLARTVWPKEFAERYGRFESYKDKTYSLNRFDVNTYNASVNADLAKLDEVEAKIEPIDAEFYRRGTWQRYVLVGGGHLHYQHCSTLRPTTQMFLLAESSGLSPGEVVARYSYTACTKCFPDAPVAPKLGAAADPTICPGSGVYAKAAPRGARFVDMEPGQADLGLYRPYGKCPECGEGVSVTKSQYGAGKFRKHKKRGAK